MIQFDDAGILDVLGSLDDVALDALPFGVVGLSPDGVTEVYNAAESRFSGLPAEKVLTRHFFMEIAPCMNNIMVAERLNAEAPLDVTIRYVITFRMRPTPVRLRLLCAGADQRRWMLVTRD